MLLKILSNKCNEVIGITANGLPFMTGRNLSTIFVFWLKVVMMGYFKWTESK
jgi:hypothetical protein